MSFFKIYKSKGYGYRHIYYDPKKEAQKEREKRMADSNEGEFKTTIRRGSFRAEAAKNKSSRSNQTAKSNIRLILIVFVLLLLAYYLLK